MLDQTILKKVKQLQINGETVVLVTGVFDILHQEHLNFLKAARELADNLIIGLESDQRVKELKGENRPINSESIRKLNLERLSIAKMVFILPTSFGQKIVREKFLNQLKPNFLAVSEHSPFQEEKNE